MRLRIARRKVQAGDNFIVFLQAIHHLRVDAIVDAGFNLDWLGHFFSVRLLFDEVNGVCRTLASRSSTWRSARLRAVAAAALAQHPAAFPDVLATSAREGMGFAELRAAIARLMAERASGGSILAT